MLSKIDVTTCQNTQRITSWYRTKTVTVNLHGANHTTSSDVVEMSSQWSFATLPSVVFLSEWTKFVILTTSVFNILKGLISALGVKPWGFSFCREVFLFAVSLFLFAMRFFFLPRGFSFCRESFSFCHEIFLFAVRFFFLPRGFSFGRDNFFCAVRFFFLPWGFSFCREVFLFAVRFSFLPWG